MISKCIMEQRSYSKIKVERNGGERGETFHTPHEGNGIKDSKW
jgi:hypothetical protein